MRSLLKYALVFLPAIIFVYIMYETKLNSTSPFDGNNAYQLLKAQLTFGPRTPESLAHSKELDFLVKELNYNGWSVELQKTEFEGHPLSNVVATRGEGQSWIILGAHYDSRKYADKDPNPTNQLNPVPGANDGASGVAVLLELSRVLPKNLDKKISLVFFDLEDQGNIPGWNWILGSRAFASSLIEKPSVVVVVDMVGDKDLIIYQEKNSDRRITNEIWQIASENGFDKSFVPEQKHAILDDQIPFLELGIPAIVIIDMEYPFHHTTEDDLSRVSAQSLSIVGNTLFDWLTSR
jgi:glutaminyl-peptide cyclotransferase